VWLVRSAAAARPFGTRVRIDDGQTLGRIDAEPMGDGSVLVTWLEGKSDQEAEWRIRRVDANGKAGPSRAVATVARARIAGFPRLARSSGSVFLAFTTPDGVRVVRIGE